MAMEGRGAGYSLLELLSSIAIIAVVASLGTSFTPLIHRERSVQAVMDLRALLNFSRQSAITLQQNITLCALDSDQRCERDWLGRDYAVFIDQDEDRQLDSGEEVLRRGHWPINRGQLHWRAALARKYIVFKLWGETAQNGSFHYCPPNLSVRNATAIIVNRAGRNYVALDKNHDGIRENARGKALSCS
jgi:type IV fimbrial biogenesis protein FimT